MIHRPTPEQIRDQERRWRRFMWERRRKREAAQEGGGRHCRSPNSPAVIMVLYGAR